MCSSDRKALFISGARTDDAYTLEEGEWIPDENDITDEGLC